MWPEQRTATDGEPPGLMQRLNSATDAAPKRLSALPSAAAGSIGLLVLQGVMTGAQAIGSIGASLGRGLRPGG
jgi:hypothetical protein